MYGCKGCGGEAEVRVITEVDGANVSFYVCRACLNQKKTFSVNFLNHIFPVQTAEIQQALGA